MGIEIMTGSEEYLKSGVIEDLIMRKDWTLNDILHKDETVSEIVQSLIHEMDNDQLYRIAMDCILTEQEIGMSVAKATMINCRAELTSMVQFILNKYLKTAKVEFNEGESNKIYEEPMEELKEKLARDEVIVEEDAKVLTLKERIRKDTKQMTEEQKKKAGMI
tara:strand:+ start:4387 stop:4875 length:489 start_codon:yes stop_codon:yes gene_type:complete